MGMGIVSDADFEREVTRSIPPPEIKIPEVLPLEKPGRSEGDNNVPDSLRKIIGETSEIEGRQAALALAEQFGISPSSVSAYANGATSTASYGERPNLDHILKVKNRISKQARAKVLKAMQAITDDKLEVSKPVELAQIARSLASVAKDMEPEVKEDNSKKGPSFIVYAPQIRDERHYEVIVARE